MVISLHWSIHSCLNGNIVLKGVGRWGEVSSAKKKNHPQKAFFVFFCCLSHSHHSQSSFIIFGTGDFHSGEGGKTFMDDANSVSLRGVLTICYQQDIIVQTPKATGWLLCHFLKSNYQAKWWKSYFSGFTSLHSCKNPWQTWGIWRAGKYRCGCIDPLETEGTREETESDERISVSWAMCLSAAVTRP